MPTKVIAKVVEKVLPGLGLILPDIEVTLEFNAAMEFNLSCSCRPCCRAPEKQVASLTVSASVSAFGGNVYFTAAGTETLDGLLEPPPLKECALWITLAYQVGERVPAVGVNLSLGGVSIRQEYVRMRFSAIPHCGCTADPRCFGNTAPSIVNVSPDKLALNQGESGTITVVATDAQKLKPFPEEISGGGYLPVRLEQAWYSEDGKTGSATYRVEFPLEGELLQGVVKISAWDECDQMNEVRVPVWFFYPPVLQLNPALTGWRKGWYDVAVDVYDPNFRGCPNPWEAVTVDVGASFGVSHSVPADETFGCAGFEQGLEARELYTRIYWVSVAPIPNQCPHWVEIVARDLRPL
ncbi:MAG: hypothetical protein N2507_03230 [Candidatus Bipolaricaulota bacterium]|nr:hypothetical protein [Candidatus Bipolaricaulota bacterium]